VSMRTGITTGTCAAAAAKAAAVVLAGGPAPAEVEVHLPSGQAVRVPVLRVQVDASGIAATAAVRKDAGDDPDVTDGLEIAATVAWQPGDGLTLAAGEGVGTVTKPGLQIPPGEPAINPVPRQMIAAAVREVTPRGARVEIAVPLGREIAARTFNPRLGIEGGLSILGTTGIVRPYCTAALHDALRCGLDVATACGTTAPVFVPGNIGAKAARRHFRLRDEQVIEVGNAWGFVLGLIATYPLDAILILGHPGKLAKLADSQWDTHSARSQGPIESLGRLCQQVLGRPAPDTPTAEGVFAAMQPEERKRLADELARRVRAAVAARIAKPALGVAVSLVNMASECLGFDGDLAPWK
jgi:cobalt-precorrin-5B (C1)-methyltransferase